MTDNIQLTQGTDGIYTRTDELVDGSGTAHWQVVKLAYGADGTAYWVGTANPLPTIDDWSLSTEGTVLTNASSVEFTVPANTIWEIRSIYVNYVASGTAGNRLLAIESLNSGGTVIGQLRAGTVLTANGTGIYQFGPGLSQDTNYRDTNYMAQMMYPIALGAGQKLKVYDKNAIGTASDDVSIYMQVASRGA